MISAIGLVFVAFQLRANGKLAIADLVVRLEAESVDRHAQTYLNMLGTGRWSATGRGPASDDDRVAIENYLSFFETVGTLVESKLIPLSLVASIFALHFLLATDKPHVQSLYLAHPGYWPALLRLDPIWPKHRADRQARARVDQQG